MIIRNVFQHCYRSNLKKSPAFIMLQTIRSNFIKKSLAFIITYFQSWNLNTHIPAAQSLGNLPRPLLAHEMSCRRASTSGIYQQTPSQSFTGFPGQARADWSASGMNRRINIEHQ